MMNAIKKISISEKITSAITGGDILFVIPPFVTTRTPIVGPHILQAIAAQQGYRAEILYLNLLLASAIGVDLYESVSYGQPFRMLGERLFARSAYGLPAMGKSPGYCLEPAKSVLGDDRRYSLEEFEYKFYSTPGFDLDRFFEVEEICHSLIKEATEVVASLNYKMAGCSTNWEQNNCSVAFINRMKQQQPGIIAMMGGSNCEGPMAEGIASLSDSIDYVFSGESEWTFTDFLKKHASGQLPEQRIIEGEPVEDMDNIPEPDYDTYFNQINHYFIDNPPPEGITIGFETSRGCWWGRCSFCGMNGKRVRYRQKAVKRTARELERIKTRHPQHRILLIDKVMSQSFQEELLPLLGKKEGTTPITCEHRPNLELEELIQLKKAGTNVVEFGIEALSTGLLKLMKKGATAKQNILLLRNARSLGMLVVWNMLWGFPGDRAAYYQETLELLPLLRHLNPPVVFRHLSLDRFCAYFENPGEYHVEGLRPWAVYSQVYPDHADLEKLAYRFIGDYPCDAHEHPDVIRNIAANIVSWRQLWQQARLSMMAFSHRYLIHDSRELPGITKRRVLDWEQAQEIMTYGVYKQSPHQDWAVREKLGVVVDSWYVPLVTASPGLLMKFQQEGQDR